MKGINFVALDFETARGFSNICEIGIAVVKDGEVGETRNWLVRPEENEYLSDNISIHGITPEMTENAPSLKDVWPEVAKIIRKHKVVVMHNAPFDRNLILGELYWIEESFPVSEYFCTYYISLYAKKYGCGDCKLGTLCNHFGITIDRQHRAADDAKATAQLFLAEMKEAGASTYEELEARYMFKRGRFKLNYGYDPQERSCKGMKVDQIKGDPTLFNPQHPLYGKTICFTGTLKDGNRCFCWQQVADIGAVPKDGVSKKLDYLVVGSLDKEKTKKMKDAEKHIEAGAPIRVISDQEYYEIIDAYNL